MTLQQLAYIVEISRCNSISKAAENLYMAQPSLSKAVSNLEKELGITIFERNSRGIQLTSRGLELLSGAKQLLEQAETLRQEFAPSTEELVRLTVSTQHYSFAAQAFMHFIHTCQTEKFELHLREGRTSQVIDDVFTHKSAIGVLYITAATERFFLRYLHERGLEFNSLATMPPHVYFRADHPLAGMSSVPLESLSPYPYISYEQGKDSWNFAEEVLSPRTTTGRIYVMDRATMLTLLSGTDGYNLGTGHLPKGELAPNVVTRPVAGSHHLMRVGWIKERRGIMTREMELYVSFLQRALEESDL